MGESYAAAAAMAASEGLIFLGGTPVDGDTLLLLGPDPATFWATLQSAPEARAPDPVDAWSTRVIGALADRLGGTARFPFGDPPEPFVTWALASGACHLSPVGLLVHETQGLNVSFRGAILVPGRMQLPDPRGTPCDTCAAPCLDACPVDALTATGYDVPACQVWLRDDRGDCAARGCAVRRICPASPPRPDAQAAHHMVAFMGEAT